MEKTDVNAPNKGTDEQAPEGNPDKVDWQKRYADSTRGAQKALEEKKAWQAAAEKKESIAVKAVTEKVISDPGYLQTIAAEDKELADKVAQQLRPKNGGKTFSNFEEFMQYASSNADGRQVRENPAGFSEESILKKLKDELNKESVEKLISSEISKLPEDKREAVKAKYEAFAGKRQLNSDEAQAFLADAKAVVFATGAGNVDELIAKMASTNTKAVNPSKSAAPSSSAKELAERLGMGYLYKEKK